MSTRPRLLFIYILPTTFVQDDLALLKESFDVRVFHFKGEGAAGMTWAWLRQLGWLLWELPRAKGVYGWFADYHLFLPVQLARWFRKPVAVVLGGFDANTLPELGYGVFASRWRAPLARSVLRHATVLLPVSGALIASENRYASWPESQAFGVKRQMPGLQTPYRVVPTGYAPADWPIGPDARPPVVCTVAYLDDDRTLKIKGIDLLFEVAAHLPEATFRIIGVTEPRAQAIRAAYTVPENVRLDSPCLREDLKEVYQQASVYLHLSRTEGLPNVVCEAMLCGCIPVGSAVGGIPEAIGEAGFIVEEPNPRRIAQVVREALQQDASARQWTRARIVTHFSLEKRRQTLAEVWGGLLQKGRSYLAAENPSSS